MKWGHDSSPHPSMVSLSMALASRGQLKSENMENSRNRPFTRYKLYPTLSSVHGLSHQASQLPRTWVVPRPVYPRCTCHPPFGHLGAACIVRPTATLSQCTVRWMSYPWHCTCHGEAEGNNGNTSWAGMGSHGRHSPCPRSHGRLPQASPATGVFTSPPHPTPVPGVPSTRDPTPRRHKRVVKGFHFSRRCPSRINAPAAVTVAVVRPAQHSPRSGQAARRPSMVLWHDLKVKSQKSQAL